MERRIIVLINHGALSRVEVTEPVTHHVVRGLDCRRLCNGLVETRADSLHVVQPVPALIFREYSRKRDTVRSLSNASVPPLGAAKAPYPTPRPHTQVVVVMWQLLVGYAIGTAQILGLEWFRERRAHVRALRLLRAELQHVDGFEQKYKWTHSKPPASDEVPNPPTVSSSFFKPSRRSIGASPTST